MNEKLPIKGTTVLNTAVALSTIFQKNKTVPDHIQFDDSYEISLVYGDITVLLGKDRYLEDKMTRVFAILPQLAGQKGILHAENVNENMKDITFVKEVEAVTAENWTGGYDENGEYTGDGEYDENGEHVGPKPMTELDYALEKWVGGYDEEGDYTGAGEYDGDGNYVGPAPTSESMEAKGDWKGGYLEDGSYTGTGEYDREGTYVGANPAAGEDGGSSTEDADSPEDGGETEETDTAEQENGEEFPEDGNSDQENQDSNEENSYEYQGEDQDYVENGEN